MLGVAPSASRAEIGRNYKQLALRYHPDRNAGDEGATQRFQKLSAAYQTLSDEVMLASTPFARVHYGAADSDGRSKGGSTIHASLAMPMDSASVPMPPPQFSGWRVAAVAAFGNHNSSACVGWSRAFADFGMPLFEPQSSGCASATTWLSLAASKLVGLQAVDAVSSAQASSCADQAAVPLRLFV